MSTFVTRVEGLMQPVEILRRLKEGAIVVCGPTGMSETDIKSALVDALFALKREPERPRIYLVVDAATDPNPFDELQRSARAYGAREEARRNAEGARLDELDERKRQRQVQR